MSTSPSSQPARMAGPGWRQRLAHLPRETRDTFFLLAVIAATAAPHGAHLPVWCSVLTAVILLWRGLLAWRGQALPGRWSLGLMLLLVGTLTWLSHRTLIGREPGITMLVMLMAMKTLELRARRDAFIVFFLGFFLVLTQYLYSQSLLTALLSLLSVWALLTAVVLAQMPVGQPSLKLAAGQAARNTLIGLPLMVLLFLLFPRIGPLWGVPSDAVGRTGLSNEMQLGALSEIANDDSIAMRLRFDGPPPPRQALYFRGPVLSRFDGRQWRSRYQASRQMWRLPDAAEARASRPVPLGQPWHYELTLEPLRISVLPLLETGNETPGTLLDIDGLRLMRDSELQWHALRPITERLRLRQQAWLDYRSGAALSPLALEPYLALPPGLNPRTLGWAAELRRRLPQDERDDGTYAQSLVQAVLEHLRSQDYIYTLAPGRYGEDSPHLIDEFWMDRRLGFCEHFSAGFVVVMRALGVPARIVTGFQGADAELQDGYLVVRNSQAHAWAEVWISGQGWRRVDPTAAVAPDRVNLGNTLQPAPGVLAGALGEFNPTLWRGLRAVGRAWEQLNNRWQQHVLNYSRGDQFDLLKQLGWRSPDWQALAQLAAAVLAALAAAGAAWAGWSARPHDPWSRQRALVVAELRRLGLAAAEHQAPRHWAALVDSAYGGETALAGSLLQLERQRYQLAAAPPTLLARWQWRRELRRQARMLRPLPPSLKT